MTEDTPPPQNPPGPTPSGPTPRAPRPPLERSRDRRVVAGVCGGLGRHLDIDPVVFRVVIAVLCVSGGVGLFIYGLAWLVVPVERTGRNELQRLLSGRVDGQSLGAVLVTVLGTGIFFSYMGSSGHIFPLLLIALLAFAALRYDPAKHPRRWQSSGPVGPENLAPGAAPGAAPGTNGWSEPTPGYEGTIFGVSFRSGPPTAAPTQPTVPVPPSAPAWWQRPDPMAKGAPEDATGEVPTDARPFEPAPPSGGPSVPAPPPPFAPQRERERRPRSCLGSAFFFLALITGSAVWMVAGHRHHSVDILAVLASALLVMGLGLLIGARWGRARSLVVWATLLTLAVVAVGASPVQLQTSFQRVTWAPTNAAALQSRYQLGAGKATLDLSQLVVGPGRNATSKIELGSGQLRVVLPPSPGGPEIKITAHAGVGDVRLPDSSTDGGLGVTRDADLNPGGAAAHGTITLDLSVGAGEVEVNQ